MQYCPRIRTLGFGCAGGNKPAGDVNGFQLPLTPSLMGEASLPGSDDMTATAFSVCSPLPQLSPLSLFFPRPSRAGVLS